MEKIKYNGILTVEDVYLMENAGFKFSNKCLILLAKDSQFLLENILFKKLNNDIMKAFLKEKDTERIIIFAYLIMKDNIYESYKILRSTDYKLKFWRVLIKICENTNLCAISNHLEVENFNLSENKKVSGEILKMINDSSKSEFLQSLSKKIEELNRVENLKRKFSKQNKGKGYLKRKKI